jgi:hypothetical protein
MNAWIVAAATWGLLATSASGAAEVPPLTVPLAAQPGAGTYWAGTATLSSAADDTLVVLSFPTMMSIPEAAFPAEIRPGTCAASAAGKHYPLAPVRNAKSTTTLHVPPRALSASPYSIVVRSAEGTRVLACGAIQPKV